MTPRSLAHERAPGHGTWHRGTAAILRRLQSRPSHVRTASADHDSTCRLTAIVSSLYVLLLGDALFAHQALSDATECGSTTVRVNTGCRVFRGVYNNEIYSIEVNLNVSIFIIRSKCPKCFKLKRIITEHCCSTILLQTQENYEH